MNIGAIILAAGKGTRMKSKHPKVLHKILEKPLLGYVLDSVSPLVDARPIVVIGHGGSSIKEYYEDSLAYREQKNQLGTGDAVKSGIGALADEEAVFVLCGDAPLIRRETLEQMLESFKNGQAGAVVLTAVLPDSTGYGRIVKEADGSFRKIVEEKDADEEVRKIREINSGTYIFNRKLLEESLGELKNDNAQGEYYLTDVLELIRGKGFKVGIHLVADSDEIIGINNRVQLEEASRVVRRRINEKLMMSGVTFEDSATAYISSEVRIGEDVLIGPNVSITGRTVIEDDVVIGPNTIIKDSHIGSGTTVLQSIILESKLGRKCNIGPFAYLRPNSELADKVKVGDFVELKKTKVGEGSKIPHHSYIGDAIVGEKVNIGAGTITCNYDGQKKYQTIIEDGSFVGSNSNLVAPVKLGKESYIGAGSTITRDVPGKALSLERNKQEIIENWKKK